MKNNKTKVSIGIETESHGILYKILRIFTVIRPSEGPTAFLLMLNAFLLFLAYYIIKPVRDALIMAKFSAEFKLYLSAAAAVLLIFVVKIFSRIASRSPRQKLITWVTLFFISNLGIFYILHLSGVGPGAMGIIFYIWAGIFSLIVVAQFWGFANDLYTEEEGKRLFPIIAFGATFGGYVGGIITKWFTVSLGNFQLMLVSAAFLGTCILITWITHKREVKKTEHKAAKAKQEEEPKKEEQEKPLGKEGAFRLVFKSRYLLYLAFFVLMLNWINTNGVYILDTIFKSTAAKAIETGTAGGLDFGQLLTTYYASFYNIMNLFAMFVQLLVVSRIFKWFGVRVAIFILPALALGGYLFISFGAVLLLVKWVKALENGLDYSLMNTTRHSLFLITTREEKYKAQAVIKSFFHRSGDVLSVALVFLGVTFLAFKVENLAMVNLVLILVWIFLGVLIAKEHKKLSAERTEYKSG
jgi:AAA family ATP:ADP antiporter